MVKPHFLSYPDSAAKGGLIGEGIDKNDYRYIWLADDH